MRISSVVAATVLVGLVIGTGPAPSFDGSRSPDKAVSPVDAYRSGHQALRTGEKARAVTSLQ